MSTIYATHGVVNGFNAHAFIHRNMLDAEAVAVYLQQRDHQFVHLAAACQQQGDALTIDDGIVAAADLARLARATGHEVTLFVNAENIAASRTYPFVLLNVFLDRLRQAEITYRGQLFDLTVMSGKEALRRWIKKDLAGLADDEAREKYLRDLAAKAGVPALPVPDHLRTLRKNELQDLIAAGVHVENHGWSHRDLSGCDAAVFAAELTQGQDWLRRELGLETRAFALPFGEALPPRRLQRSAGVDWFLLEGRLRPGLVGHRLYNRLTLSQRKVANL